MRDDLVGYLFDALDAAEVERVESALADPQSGPALRRELEQLRLATKPLARDRSAIEVPPGLAQRTIQSITQSSAIPMPRVFTPEGVGPPRVGSKNRMDRLMLAAIAIAASVLVGPLLLDSITDSQSRRVERNLQKVSVALQGYAEAHRVFPTPPDAGPLSRAGLYAPTLVSEQRLLADDGTLLCPGTALANSGSFRIPTLEELKAAVGTEHFSELVANMGGDYGYTLGYREAGKLQPNANNNRQHHPIMADAPNEEGTKSSNHPDGMHHVLYEDGHVERLALDAIGHGDHIFQNHDGRVAAGVDSEDAVIGDSHHQP